MKTIKSLFDKMDKSSKKMFLDRKEVAESEKKMREELTGLFRGFGNPMEKRMADLAVVQNT